MFRRPGRSAAGSTRSPTCSGRCRSPRTRARRALAEIWNAEEKDHARKADGLRRAYGAKFPKAVAKITEDEEELLAFYDYPAEHWVHLRPPTRSSRRSPRSGCDEGHQGPRFQDRRPGDGLQANRVRPAALAHRERTPPSRAHPAGATFVNGKLVDEQPGRGRRDRPAGSRLKDLDPQVLTITPNRLDTRHALVSQALMQLEREGKVCKHVSPESGAEFWFSPSSETFCSTCGQLALPGVHTQPECPRRKQQLRAT